LRTEELKDIFEQLSNTTIRNVNFGGGELMLRQDISELVEYASKLGFNVTIVTNGLLINQENARDLVCKGVRGVYVSLDGPEPVHDKVRGVKGAYQRTLIGLTAFADLKQKTGNLKVNIAATIMKPTLPTLLHVVKLAEKLDISVSFNLVDSKPYFFNGIELKNLWIEETQKLDDTVNTLIAIKRQQPSLISNSIQSLEYAKQYFRDPLRKDVPCLLGFIELFFGSRGDVYPCWATKAVGSTRERKLKNILSSDLYRSNLNDMWAKKCPGCSCGYIPNLDFQIPTFFKELLMLPKFTLERILSL
jgi:MoaA/NifB/PqqE/SkfB family radical SAM enzyme